MPTGLLLIAHGSPDPRHAAAMNAIADDVRGDVEAHVALGFLDHDQPSAADALAELVVDNRQVIAVSLLLSSGVHAEIDVPALFAAAPAHRPVRDAGPLGLGPWVIPLLERRANAVAPDGTHPPVILCATGSGHDASRVEVFEAARQWEALRRTPVSVAFATGAGPSLEDVMQHGSHAEQPVVVPLALTEGVIYDRIVAATSAAGLRVAPVLAPSHELTDRIVTLARGQVVLPEASISA